MLAILTTHPIQYQIPLWQALAKDNAVPFKVWYLTDHGIKPSFDQQFGKTFAWDLDALAGYPYSFLKVNHGAEVGGFRKIRLVEPLQRVLQEENVKALWIQGWQVQAYWQAVRNASAVGVPVWLRGESNDLSVIPKWKKPIKKSLLTWLFNRVDNFLYIGQANKRLYENFGVRPDRLYPAPYCVDNERFARTAEELLPQRASIRSGWNIPEDAFCVLFAGKFIHKKRPLDIIKATHEAQKQNPKRKVHLIFVGSGELGGEIRRACNIVFDAEDATTSTVGEKANDLPDASFVGFLNQTEISRAYVAADCLVLPSDHRETWGLVVNEAMASGLPCIVSDACGCGEDLVAPINPALRFPLGDYNALADALLLLMESSYSPAILQAQVSKFDLSHSVKTIKQLYSAQN
jgi:glycosyltransferase involved in cell wall biosynthesis